MFVNGNGICCRFMQQVFVRIDAFRYAHWRGWFTAKVTLESDECEEGDVWKHPINKEMLEEEERNTT